MSFQLHECTVCGLLDQDFRSKMCSYCPICDAWLCAPDVVDIARRAAAMYKRSKNKLNKWLDKVSYNFFMGGLGYDDGFSFVEEFGVGYFPKVSVSAGTWTHIQDCNGAGTLVCTFPVNPTQHDTVLIYIGATAAAATLSCVDGSSNAYTVSSVHGGGPTGGLFAYVAYLLDAPANANKTITCSNGGGGFNDTLGSQFRDTGGTPVLDAVYGSADPADSGAGATIVTPTFTPAVAGSLGFSGVLPNNGISSANSPWTLGVNSNSATEYRLSTPASSTHTDFTDLGTNDNYASIAIVVKP